MVLIAGVLFAVTDIDNLPEHVTYYERPVTRKDGSINVERSIRVFLKVIAEGKKKRISRTISVKQNGLDNAVEIAVKWIEEQHLISKVLSAPAPVIHDSFDWSKVNKKYINRGSSITVRVPGSDSKIFNNSFPKDAIAYRDKMCAELGIDIEKRTLRKNSGIFAKKRPNSNKKNKKLAVGIYYSEYKRIDMNGNISNSRMYRASVNVPDPETGKIIKLNFSRSVNFYGHERALKLVTDWRNERVSKHYVKE